ncbi:MAG: DUF1566 domain-containing protein [Candidatus Electrothrix sp. EH2]|nr:DUF1566 domain-containing protein [Candidatus Electrothrix sp. EH2]
MRFFIYLMSCVCLLGASYVFAACDTDLTPSTDHLSVDTDGNIYDSKTGLIWKKCLQGFSGTNCEPEGTKTTFTWPEALGEADSTWRLPNAKELQSIVELRCSAPAIDTTSFPGTHSTGVWTNSPVLSGTFSGKSLYVTFNAHGNVLAAERAATYNVRLVRDASLTE